MSHPSAPEEPGPAAASAVSAPLADEEFRDEPRLGLKELMALVGVLVVALKHLGLLAAIAVFLLASAVTIGCRHTSGRA